MKPFLNWVEETKSFNEANTLKNMLGAGALALSGMMGTNNLHAQIGVPNQKTHIPDWYPGKNEDVAIEKIRKITKELRLKLEEKYKEVEGKIEYINTTDNERSEILKKLLYRIKVKINLLEQLEIDPHKDFKSKRDDHNNPYYEVDPANPLHHRKIWGKAAYISKLLHVIFREDDMLLFRQIKNKGYVINTHEGSDKWEIDADKMIKDKLFDTIFNNLMNHLNELEEDIKLPLEVWKNKLRHREIPDLRGYR